MSTSREANLTARKHDASASPFARLLIVIRKCTPFLVAAVACQPLPSANGDTLRLTNGRTVEGEILEDVSGKPLVFRYKSGSEWKTNNVDRSKIADYQRNQSNPTVSPPANARQSEEREQQANQLRPASESEAPKSAPLPKLAIPAPAKIGKMMASTMPPPPVKGGEVVILRMNGPFAHWNIHGIGDVISSIDFGLMMNLAKDRRPAAVVLEIDSGGGLTSEMELIIERLIEEQSPPRALRIIAWVNLGGSAAALTALACKELVMFPAGRLGAATATINGQRVPEPTTAGEQKARVMEDARRRQVADLTGRSIAIQEAMEFPERRLWAHKTAGFSPTKRDDPGWAALDDDETLPMALGADELLRYGIAEGTAGSIDKLFEILRLPPKTPFVVVDLADEKLQFLLAPAKAAAKKMAEELDKAEKAYRKKLDQLSNHLDLAMRAAEKISNSDKPYAEADLQALRLALSRCQNLFLSESLREALKTGGNVRLDQHDFCIKKSDQSITRASQTALILKQSLPIDDIQSDIIEAMRWVYRAKHGEEPEF